MNIRILTEDVSKMSDTKSYYLAYGSNLNVEQMTNRCPGAKRVGSFYLNGYRLVFRGVADFEKDTDSKLALGLWEITEKDEKALDRYEGVNRGHYRKILWLIDFNEVKYKALIYKMNSDSVGSPDEYYKDTIEEGFNNFNLNKKYLEESLSHAEVNSEGKSYTRQKDRSS
jgi:hypothetical protein|tara:strand:+ start:17 stop:526 length:510 start_codon:yes stop_codon:yes gene_type:complete